jgi:hypothetical protein
MAEISMQQVYDLASDILHDLVRLEASIDDILLDLRAHNREMSLARQSSDEIHIS